MPGVFISFYKKKTYTPAQWDDIQAKAEAAKNP